MNTTWIDFLTANKATVTSKSEIQFPNNTQQTTDFINATTHLGIIKVTGEDSTQFLQGQLTCNMNDLTESNSFFSAFCNAKGRTISTLLVTKTDDAFLLILPLELLDKVVNKLQMYIMRSDVKLLNLSEELCLLGLTSSITDLPLPLPKVNFATTHTSSAIAIRFPAIAPRYLMICSTEQAISLWKQLTLQYTIKPDNSATWVYQDISAGIPWLTQTSSEEYTPQMLNIEELGGISFNKGCYTGQEVIARTHYLGKAKRKLFLAECSNTAMLDIDTQIVSKESEQILGKILSLQTDGKKTRLLIVLSSSDSGFNCPILNNLCQDKIQIMDFLSI